MSAAGAGSDGLVLEIRLTPRAASDRIDGLGALSDGREVLLARVRAVPEDGRANDALCRLLADAFGLPRSAVTVVTGQTARLKRVRLAGDRDRLATILASLASRGA